MTTPLLSFSINPSSIPISTNTSWPNTTTVTQQKYKIIYQNNETISLRRTLSHMQDAYKDAEPYMEKCNKGDVILINWYARPIYHYPEWHNFLYEPRMDITYCYLRKQEDNIFYEYHVSDQDYDTIVPIWKYSVTPLPSKNDIFRNDRYTFSRVFIRWIIFLFSFFIALRISL